LKALLYVDREAIPSLRHFTRLDIRFTNTVF